MPTDRMSRIERENAEALHFLSSPVRFLMAILKGAMFLSGMAYLLFLNQVGWVTDMGPRSQHARLSKIERIERHLKHYEPGEMYDPGEMWVLYQVDFRSLPDLNEVTPDNRYHTVKQADYALTDFNEPERPTGVKPFDTHELAGAPLAFGIPYCVAPSDIFDTTAGPWSDRGTTALDRKAARMRRDYEAAAVMTAALRSTLVNLKLHRSIKNVYGPSGIVSGQDPNKSYCNAISSSDRAFRETSQHVVLSHAPVVRLRYIHFDTWDADADPRRLESQMLISGICLPEACTGGEKFGVTYVADIFAKEPPLTEEQLAAEKAMLAMTTKDFWLQAAQENGVADLAAVENMRQLTLIDLQSTFNDPNFGI